MTTHSTQKPPSIPLLAFFFIGSGFSALAYQVILSRYAQLIVGATAYAISALLVAFMLGMSLGAAWGGRLADKTRHPLRIYALAEGAIGLYCIAFPLFFPYLTELYLAIVPPPSETAMLSRNVVRFILGVSAFLLPTFFMGMTTPAFARAVAANRENSGAWLARLYGWNTLGAALGALTTAYVLVPKLGLTGSIVLATIINFSIAGIAFQRSQPVEPSVKPETPEYEPEDPAESAGSKVGLIAAGLVVASVGAYALMTEVNVVGAFVSFVLRRTVWVLVVLAASIALLLLAKKGVLEKFASRPTIAIFLLAAFASGYLSFALEIIWTHLLAILLGNSVYAFGLMLGSLLLGLAIGTVFARRLASPPRRARNWIGFSIVIAGLCVIFTLGVWDEIPALFLLFANQSPSFALMEGVRFAVALVLMLLPTASFGITFPLTLHCASTQETGFGKQVGRVYAVNTMGGVLGAISGPYLFLPVLGSMASLKLLGALLLVAGGTAIYVLADIPQRKAVAALCVSAILWGPLFPVTWDFNALNMAAAIYLGDSASARGEMLYRREDATGGLTSVVEERGVRTLLTNGKFQGDNAEEIPIQHRAANIPTLFTAERERALVIGLGTGVTLAALAAHGFDEVVCAEISEPIIEAAGEYFSDVNGDILNADALTLVQEDGRSILLESPDRYDVITVEVSSIWFAGVGAIYSREFYELASSRLRRNGVLLQWFPIHHLSARNLFLVVNTVRSVFPNVSLWTHRHQAFVVAGNEPLLLDLNSVRSDQERPSMRSYLRELSSGSPLELLSDLVVNDEDMDGFLDSMAVLLRTKRSVVSTDTWPTLEYETPKDVLENFSYFQNRATFKRFRSVGSFGYRGEATASELALADAAFARGWDDPRALPRLARLWSTDPSLSDAASQWLYDELTGEDAFGSDFPEDPIRAFQKELPAIGHLVASSGTSTTCAPIPRFVSQLERVPLKVHAFSGESQDGTEPADAIDGVYEPTLAKGWRARPDGRPVFLDVRFETPVKIDSVHLIVRPVDGSVARTRLLGRDAAGAWHPLASGGQVADILCDGSRRFELSDGTPALTGLRVEVQGEGNSFRIALHEVWAVVGAS